MLKSIKFDLNAYRSPIGEYSYYKGVPIEFRDLVRKILKSKGLKYKFRYRGPRIHGNQSFCTIGDAKTFAIYRR